MVILDSEETVLSVEKHLEAILEEVVLQLPKHITCGIGVDAAILQLLMTWSQRQQDPSIRIQDPECDNVVCLSAITLSQRVLSWDGADLWQVARSNALSARERMVAGTAGFQKGATYAEICFDNTSTTRNPNLYYGNGDVLSARDLGFALSKRIGLDVTWLGTLLYEAFQNTKKWGQTTVEGVPIRRSARGVYLRRSLQHPSTEGTPIDEFLGRNSEGTLEVSIFDGGPGLVRRLCKIHDLNIPIEDERNHCFSCFDQFKTSSPSPYRGMGLYDVLRVASEHRGFLRLRTGRLHLYRDFSTHPFPDGGKAWFTDWPSPHTAPEVAGTVLTFVFPSPP